MRDLVVMQRERAALSAIGTTADGLVRVTVDAQGIVTEVEVDESYLDEYDLSELGRHVTTAAQAASHEVARRGEALLAPLTARRQAFSPLGDGPTEVPGFVDAIQRLVSSTAPARPLSRAGSPGSLDDDSFHPTVRT